MHIRPNPRIWWTPETLPRTVWCWSFLWIHYWSWHHPKYQETQIGWNDHYWHYAQQQETVADPLKNQWRRQRANNITPDAIAHQLLLNGKPDQNCNIHNKKAVLKTDSHETILTTFNIWDLGDAISFLNNNKAPGLDNIHHEMIKFFGPTTWLWLLDMFNDCLKQQQITNV